MDTSHDSDQDLTGPDELLLPAGKMLLAAIYGEPKAPHVSGSRWSFLCATSSRDIVVRSSSGLFVYTEKDADPEGLLPEDWGDEAFAMTDIAHLTDWLNDEDPVAVTPAGVARGLSEHLGPYTAQTHPEHRFVTSLKVGTNPYLRPCWR